MGRRLFQETVMKCAICRNGTTLDGHVTIVLERDQTTLVFKHVPAKICDNCGEEYISAEVNRVLFRRAREEIRRGVVLEMLNYAA
jgi:YgiT-type zinc finger domain-containing protein